MLEMAVLIMSNAMSAKKYRAELSKIEREELTGLVNKGKAAAYKHTHAKILLKADQIKAPPKLLMST